MKYPLYMAVADALKSKFYPQRVKVFLCGLKACLLMYQRREERNMEKLIFYVYRTAYELGAGEHGGDMEVIHREMPNFGLDESDGNRT